MDVITFSKTVSESDVYLFAGITGDLAPNHVDAAFMAKSAYGQRIAHGALIVGYMSAASSRAVERGLAATQGSTPVSLGYDRIRFLAPVYFGDTITVRYTVGTVDPIRARSEAQIEVTKQDGTLVAVATHVMKWVPDAP